MKCLVTLLVLFPVLTASGDDPPYKKLMQETHKELAGAQQPDGRWAAPAETPEGLTDEGVTALGLLVLTGAGNTHRHGDYKENVRKGLAYLVGSLDDKGRASGSFANQALVTMAITELYAVSRDFSIKKAVMKAN